MSEWIARYLVRWHVPLLGVALLVAAAGLPLSRQLDLDWRVEAMFPPGDPLVDSYRHLQERFGGNDICLAVYHDPQLWDTSGAGLERLDATSRALSEIEGVQAVLSLAELHNILQKLRGPFNLLRPAEERAPPLLDPDDELAQALANVFEGYTHRHDSEYVAIACLLTTTSADQARTVGPANYKVTLQQIQATLADLPQPAHEGFVTGEPVLVAEGFRMVQRDGWRMGLTSSVLVSLVLLLCFRSVRWTLIPLAVVHWSLVVTQATLVLCDFQLTMISSTLTAIVTVIGVATSMHLLLKFQDERRRGATRARALQQTLSVLLAPVLWACVTDAVGFSALMVASVGPVRDFGLMMAIGSLTVFVVAILVLVPGLALLGSFDTDPSTPQLDFAIRLWLRRMLNACLKRRVLGLTVLAGCFVFGLLGSLRMQVETDFTKNFHPSSPIVQGYAVIERELGGAGVWDIMLAAPVEIDADYLEQVRELEVRLRQLEIIQGTTRLQLTKVLSIADAVQAAQAGPLLSALPVSAKLTGMRSAMPEFTGALLTPATGDSQTRWLRIMLRSREQVPAAAKAELVDLVKRELQEFTRRPEWTALFDQRPPESQVAGYHVMLTKLVSNVLSDQWRCFALATAGIYLVMVIATRSLLLGLATLLPNALPILLVLGGIGWLETRANMGVAMIAAVSLGLSVDSSIHYLLHYQRRRRSGASPKKALRSAQENVGLAVVLATVALVAGFLSLCLSEFVPTVVFGSLASLTMLGGLIGNLVLLPLLIARP